MSGEDPQHIMFVKTMPCVFAGHGCFGPIDPHHEPRRHGGRRKHDHTVIPVCRRHHDQIQHPRSLDGSPLESMTLDQYFEWHHTVAKAIRFQFLQQYTPEPKDIF